MSEFDTLEDIDLQLLQLHLLVLCVLSMVVVVDVNIPDDENSRNFCDDDIGCGSVFVRCFVLILIFSLSRLMLSDERRRAHLSKPPIRKISTSSAVAFECFAVPSIGSFFCFNEHSTVLVDVPFWLADCGLQTLSLSGFASATEALVLCNEIGGVGGSFSYSRTGRSFRLRNRDAVVVLLWPMEVAAEAVRLFGDFVDDAAHRHLCDVLLLV